MGIRRAGREAAVRILYTIELSEKTPVQAADDYWTDRKVSSELKDFVMNLVTGVLEMEEKINEAIEAASSNWPISRMGEVERSVLRLAVFELTASPDVPTAVVINEAVELAKQYASKESALFINGVLGKIQGNRNMIEKEPANEK